jgi:hypothetical protein
MGWPIRIPQPGPLIGTGETHVIDVSYLYAATAFSGNRRLSHKRIPWKRSPRRRQRASSKARSPHSATDKPTLAALTPTEAGRAVFVLQADLCIGALGVTARICKSRVRTRTTTDADVKDVVFRHAHAEGRGTTTTLRGSRCGCDGRVRLIAAACCRFAADCLCVSAG